jgi:hypothetical protein
MRSVVWLVLLPLVTLASLDDLLASVNPALVPYARALQTEFSDVSLLTGSSEDELLAVLDRIGMKKPHRRIVLNHIIEVAAAISQTSQTSTVRGSDVANTQKVSGHQV